MTAPADIIVTWNCGSCDEIHTANFPDTDTGRNETKQVITALTLGVLIDMMTGGDQ